MNTYYETFLRKEIYPDEDDKTEIVCQVWEEYPKERRYIELVIDDYISGGSRYQARKRLQWHIIDVYKRIEKKSSYLDEEFKKQVERGW